MLGNADVDFDAGLSGVVFESAPGLPGRYKEKIFHWGNGRERDWDTGAVHHQNEAHEYFIDLSTSEADGGEEALKAANAILSEGFVCRVPGLGGRLRSAGAAPTDFASFAFLTGDALVDDVEGEGCEYMPRDGASPFPQNQKRKAGNSNEVLFSLMARDVWASPDPDELFIDLVRFELLDYGYYY